MSIKHSGCDTVVSIDDCGVGRLCFFSVIEGGDVKSNIEVVVDWQAALRMKVENVFKNANVVQDEVAKMEMT